MKKTVAVLFVLCLLASPCLAVDRLTIARVIDGDTLQLSNGEKVHLIGVDTSESTNNPKLRKNAKRTRQDATKIFKLDKEAAEFTRKLVMANTSYTAEAKALSRVPVVSGAPYDAALVTALPGNPVVTSHHGTTANAEVTQVRLEYDAQKKDMHGRTLAYVYIPFLVGQQPDPAVEVVTMDKTPWIFVNGTIIKAGYAQVMTDPPNVKYQDLFVKLEKEARKNKRGFWK